MSDELTGVELELLELKIGPGGTRPSDWLPRLVAEVRHLRAENERLTAAMLLLQSPKVES